MGHRTQNPVWWRNDYKIEWDVDLAGQLLPGANTLTLRVHPDLRLAEWRAGSFRIADGFVSEDLWQTLVLQSATGRLDGARPSARVVVGGPDYAVRERLWWRVAADRSTLTAELKLSVTRGPLDHVPLLLPAGWDVERVEFGRPDSGATWSLAPDRSSLALGSFWFLNCRASH